MVTDRRDDSIAKEQRARERVAEIKGFYIHLIVFIAVLLLLLAVNIAAGDSWWVHWVLFGWGIGVAVHAIAIFGSTPRFVRRWEERKVQEYLDSK